MPSIIDISHYNGSGLDFGAAKMSGVLGVISKATQGTSVVDPMWAMNREKVLDAGLLFGSYHFADGSDGSAQAEWFLKTVGPKPGELLCLDFEQNTAGSTMSVEEAQAFVTTIFDNIGKWPVLYGGQYLKQTVGRTPDPVLSKCPLWLAQYGPTAVLPAGWASWTLWQFTDGSVGSPPPVPGIGHCDQDRYNGPDSTLPGFWASVSA